mmetsp:Transcript_17900/g.43150  ORF Transcript_17900/g.43150 Transcript_17900/m.43150 type:complete len:262 (-) Transcript_17900:279-1064(-)
MPRDSHPPCAIPAVRHRILWIRRCLLSSVPQPFSHKPSIQGCSEDPLREFYQPRCAAYPICRRQALGRQRGGHLLTTPGPQRVFGAQQHSATGSRAVSGHHHPPRVFSRAHKHKRHLQRCLQRASHARHRQPGRSCSQQGRGSRRAQAEPRCFGGGGHSKLKVQACIPPEAGRDWPEPRAGEQEARNRCSGGNGGRVSGRRHPANATVEGWRGLCCASARLIRQCRPSVSPRQGGDGWFAESVQIHSHRRFNTVEGRARHV